MKNMRKIKGLSQKQLAKRVGVSQAYISKIERGDIYGITLNKLEKLSNGFEISIYEMLKILMKGI